MLSNELLFFLAMGADFLLALLLVRYFGRVGLYGLIAFNTIICNIQAFKIITLFGFNVNLGNVAYGSIFLVTDLISEVYGRKDAHRAVHFGFAMLVLFAITIQLTLMFTPNEQDIVSQDLYNLFQWTPRLTLASIVAFLVSQTFDVWIFHWAKEMTQGRHLWFRNNLSTMVAQTLDTFIFTAIAFIGLVEMPVLWALACTNLVIKWIVALIDTPFVYLGRRWLLEYHASEPVVSQMSAPGAKA